MYVLVERDGSTDVPSDTGPPVFHLRVTCGITTPAPSPVPSPVPTPVPSFEFVTRLELNATMRVEFATPADFDYPVRAAGRGVRLAQHSEQSGARARARECHARRGLRSTLRNVPMFLRGAGGAARAWWW